MQAAAAARIRRLDVQAEIVVFERSGFISYALGMEVTIVQRPRQLMNPFGSDIAVFIHSEMRKHGVKLALGYTVEGFAERAAQLYCQPHSRRPQFLRWFPVL